MSIYTDAQEIIHSALEACLPDQAVRRALEGKELGSGRVFLVALGKAAWQMARCAAELLGPRLEQGVVVTKHGHSQGDIPRCQVFEGGHPVPDEGSFRGTRAAMELVQDLAPQDTVVLLVSGGWAMRPISSPTSSAVRPGRPAPSWPPSPAPTGRKDAPWPSWRGARRWSSSPARGWAAATRSWPCPPLRGSPAWRTP